MAESRPRRGHGEDSIYYDQANHYWVAAVSLGYKGGKRVRRKVTGRTKTEVRAKLRDLRRDLDHGVRPARPARSATVRPDQEALPGHRQAVARAAL